MARRKNQQLITSGGSLAYNVAAAAATAAAAHDMAKQALTVGQQLGQKARANRAARGSKNQTKARGESKLGGNNMTSKAINPPVSMGYFLGSNSFSQMGANKYKETVVGHTMLGAVSSATSTTSILAIYNLMPTLFADRMATVAGTYDKYVYKNVRAVYTPTCSTATSGSIMIYFDRDVMDTPANPNNLQQFMSAENASLGPVYSKVETMMKRDNEEKRTYFTSVGSTIEPHELCQFKLIVGGTGMTPNVPLGLVTLYYELELMAPVFAPAEVNTAFTQFSQYVNGTGNVSFNAASATTSSVPFSIAAATLGLGNVWEVVVLDMAGATVSPNMFIGSGLPQPFVTRNGITFYLVAAADNSPADTAAYEVYTTYQGALTRSPGRLFNNNGGVTALYTASVRIAYRAIGSQVSSATIA
jgi:hypothetical protein